MVVYLSHDYIEPSSSRCTSSHINPFKIEIAADQKNAKTGRLEFSQDKLYMTVYPKSDFKLRITTMFAGQNIQKRDQLELEDEAARKRAFLTGNLNVDNIDLGRGNLKMQRTRLFQYVDKIIGEQAVWEKMQLNIGKIKQERLKATSIGQTLKAGNTNLKPLNDLFDNLA